MAAVDPKYLAQASGPAQSFVAGGVAVRNFRVASGQVEQLFHLIATDPSFGLGEA